MKRITVNLAPVDLRKEGPSFDLPIAVVSNPLLPFVVKSWPTQMTRPSGELSLMAVYATRTGISPMVDLARDLGASRNVVDAAATSSRACRTLTFPYKHLCCHLNSRNRLPRSRGDGELIDEEVLVRNRPSEIRRPSTSNGA